MERSPSGTQLPWYKRHKFAEWNASLLESGDYSDFTIECGSRQFEVHRAIICPQAPFFNKICSAPFQEGINRHAILRDTDPVILERALRFFYTGMYDNLRAEEIDNASASMAQTGIDDNNLAEKSDAASAATVQTDSKSTTEDPLLVNVQLYRLAEYFQASHLQDETFQRCEVHLMEFFDPKTDLNAIKEAFDNGPPGEGTLRLRQLILRACADNKPSVENYPPLVNVLMEFEPIAWELLKNKQLQVEAELKVERDTSSQLRRDKTNLDLRLKAAESHTDAFKRINQKMCQSLLQHDRCRNCDQIFGAKYQVLSDGSPDGTTLRCKSCSCRHR